MDSSSQTGRLSSCNLSLAPKFCKCEEPEPCILQASNSVSNPERRYYHCCRRGRRGDCKYWEWVDPVLPEYYKNCLLKMKVERDLAVEELVRQRANKADKSNGDEGVIPQSDGDEEYKMLGTKIHVVEKRMKLLYFGFVLLVVVVFFGWV